jgi:hypothetical protein
MTLAAKAASVVAAYALDEASGNAVEQVNGYDATETGGTIASAAGKLGNARDFEAVDTEWFQRADNADLSVGNIDFMARVDHQQDRC